MRHALLGGLLLITTSAGFGQNRPSMTWEGDVDGTALLMVQGDRVTVDTRSTGSVARTSYRFRESLDARERIDVENRQGNARVRVVEQPRRANDYTALVEIDTRNRSMQRVSLDFYWDERVVSRNRAGNYGQGTRGRTNDRGVRNGSGLAHWSGQVDSEVFVLMRGRQFFSTAVRGRPVYDQQTDITNPLPRRAVNVTLRDAEGRGQIEIAEQPDSSNNFTAKIRITDRETGAGAYRFTLAWDQTGFDPGYDTRDNTGDNTAYDPGYRNGQSSGVLTPGGAGIGTGTGASSVRWTGQVDGRVRVSFRDNQAFVQRLSGQDVYGQQVSFGSAVPRRTVDVDINKLRGRGDVNVVQRPSQGNNYTLVVEINDSDGGSDVYDLEIAWR